MVQMLKSSREAGLDNNIIFGLSAAEVSDFYAHNGYKPREIYEKG